MSNEVTPLLIDINEFQSDKLIPDITDTEKVERAVREAQEFDIAPLLGEAFYSDILLNYIASNSNQDDPYLTLIQGDQYEDSDGNTIIFPGLRMVIKYYAFARHIISLPVNIESNSITEKTTPYSNPTSEKKISNEVAAARAGAVAYWEKTKKFLKARKTDYPLWEGEKQEPTSGVKISIIGGRYH